LDGRFLAATTVSFLVTYLSWEASGFILLALFAGILVIRSNDWQWIADRRLWRCLAIVSTVVILQLCFRQLTLIPEYLGFIKDLSQLTTPAFVPLDRLVFDPFYYIKTFFLAETHAALTLVSLLALPLTVRIKPLLYLNVLLVSL